MGKKKIRVGVIGLGSIGPFHIDGILKSPDLELGALCDLKSDRLEEKRKLYDLSADKCFKSYTEMMDSGKIDAVSICTPNDVHYEMAMEAVKRNMPYALEKPVCNSASEAKKLMDITKEKNIPNMVCFSYRFIPAARYAREIVLSGDLGRIYHINCDYLQSWGLPHVNTKREWRFHAKEAGTGVIGDLGTHMYDMFRFLTGKEFTRLTADYDTIISERPLVDNPSMMGIVDIDDYVNIAGQMDGKIAVYMAITRFAYSRGNYQRIEVYGDKGAVSYTREYSYPDGKLHINMGSKPMEKSHIWVEIPVPDSYESSQMQSFADLINGCGDGLAPTIEDGYYAQVFIDKAVEAGKIAIKF